MTKLTTDRVHELKIYPEFFHPVCTGNKRSELRKNDRDYQVGDTLHLCEYSHTTGRTGEYVNVIVTHVADVSDWLPDYVLLSIKLPDNDAAPILPKQPVIPEGLIKAINRLLDNDGSRGKFSAMQSYDARENLERLLAAAQPVSEPYKLEIDMDDADHFSITHLHEIIYGKELIWPEAKLLARFMLDVKQRASAAHAQESE